MRSRSPAAAAIALLAVSACDVGAVEPAVQCETAAAAPSLRSRCGARLDFTPINAYAGDFPDVQLLEEAVVLINGNCSGTLIDGGEAGELVLTAGHCVGLGDDALLVFNHEDCADGLQTKVSGHVVERSLTPDYALLTLAQPVGIAPTPLGRALSDRLAIVQHPLGQPKVIAEGHMQEAAQGRLRYADLDTLTGGSGAGVLNTSGALVAVHSSGDCSDTGGANTGWLATEIVQASARLDETMFAPGR
ncbi:MAG: serine protease [Kofleriaceae bacterium]